VVYDTENMSSYAVAYPSTPTKSADGMKTESAASDVYLAGDSLS
jgi:hypothetical protein